MTTKSILDHPAISGCYLFPQSRSVSPAFVVPVDGAELACYHRVVDLNQFTLVHFHGNGEAVADYVPWMADALATLGLNSLFVEYRQYGRSTGGAELVAMLGDGEAVMAAAGIRPELAIAFGRSIGSLYAIELVHRLPTMAGLILESGIAVPAERFLVYATLPADGITKDDVIAEANLRFNHQQKLAGYTNPLLILHTEHDQLVDISHAERNFRWAASPVKQLVRFPAGDHNSILGRNRQQYFSALAQFVNLVTKP